MSLRYLVDTDWAIDYMNGQPEIVERMEEFEPEGIGLCIVSLAELYEGVFYSRDPEGSKQGLRDLLDSVTLVFVDEQVCEVFGRQRGRLLFSPPILAQIVHAVLAGGDSELCGVGVSHDQPAEHLFISISSKIPTWAEQPVPQAVAADGALPCLDFPPVR